MAAYQSNRSVLFCEFHPRYLPSPALSAPSNPLPVYFYPPRPFSRSAKTNNNGRGGAIQFLPPPGGHCDGGFSIFNRTMDAFRASRMRPRAAGRTGG